MYIHMQLIICPREWHKPWANIQVSETLYPLMFQVALDVLPVQASAVPCERVFSSSSKETCTDRRNRILPKLLEVLQIIKYVDSKPSPWGEILDREFELIPKETGRTAS